MAKFDFIPGKCLPNGAIIIHSKKRRDDTSHVVLARFEEDKNKKYVTWLSDSEGHTFLGHYFNSLGDAAVDFVTR